MIIFPAFLAMESILALLRETQWDLAVDYIFHPATWSERHTKGLSTVGKVLDLQP